ncbi:MAG: N-methyl-L-tryptophan oxidase, partial [Phycisphaerales bacterium]
MSARTAITRTGTVVVGLGAHGSAALLALSRRGEPCLGIEAGPIPGPQGSSHGSSRIIRLCYYEHPDYVPLLRKAYTGWDRLERESGLRLRLRTGGVYFGTPDMPDFAGALHSARVHRLRHTLLTPAAARRAFPAFRLDRASAALVEPTAGVLLPERAISAMVTRSLALGAGVAAHERVIAWQSGPRGVEIHTRGLAGERTVRAKRAIFTAGAWMGELLPDLAPRLSVTRQTLLWVAPRKPELFRAPRLGVFCFHNADGSLHYGFPLHKETADAPGLKVALHAPGQPTSPKTIDRRVTADDEATVRAFLRQRIPMADGPVLAIRTCLYTSTRDGHFLIDRHPAHPRVTFASACSGHGFKFAPVIG